MPQQLIYTHFWRPFWTCLWDLLVSLMKLFLVNLMFVDPSIIVQFLQWKPNKMQQCIKILLFLILNKAQHVSGNTPPIIRSLKLHKQPLVLHMWEVVGCAVVGRCHVCKTRGCLCSFRLLMVGGVSPETCWASFKIRNNKMLIHCCILLGFSL